MHKISHHKTKAEIQALETIKSKPNSSILKSLLEQAKSKDVRALYKQAFLQNQISEIKSHGYSFDDKGIKKEAITTENIDTFVYASKYKVFNEFVELFISAGFDKLDNLKLLNVTVILGVEKANNPNGLPALVQKLLSHKEDIILGNINLNKKHLDKLPSLTDKQKKADGFDVIHDIKEPEIQDNEYEDFVILSLN